MCEKDGFKEDFKFYKRKKPIPNLDKVIDFELYSDFDDVLDARETYLCADDPDKTDCLICQKLNLKCHLTWELFTLKGLEGFIYIRNPFSVTGQQTWIQKCLEQYPNKPSTTNLDIQFPNVNNIWSFRNDPDPEKRSYIKKLCWATLGYHHNWDTKVYDPNHKSDFPPCLQELSSHIANCLGFVTYKPEAAIVNYYNLKSSLSIHNDHSEENIEAPIISISLGQTGLFLIGTENKLDKPHALFLRSGDVIIMSGACRLSYHAVPCILTEDISGRYCDSQNDESIDFYEYINKSRINISGKQSKHH